MKGYKVTNTDMTCRGFQYEVGKTYKYEGEINICNVGFHFCEQLKDCYNYYSFDHKNVVLEVEGSGEVITEGDKTVCSELKVIRKLELSEVLYDLNLFTKNNRGSYNQGSSNRGSSNRGSYNQGSGNRGSSNRGSGNQGSENKGSENKGSKNKGSGNQGSYNQGSGNRGSENKGSGNRGSSNRGSYNQGSGNRGSSNRGSGNQGSENKGSENKGSKNKGSGNRGSSNRGSGNRGLMNFGSHSCGAFNSKSFIGDKDNAYCFDKPTGLTLTQFYRQHMEVLKGAKRYSFSDIESLPNYSQKKWDKMRRYL